MDNQPFYIPFGAILGILATVALFILEFSRLVRTIQRFCRFVYRGVREMWEIIRCWYWWKQYQPTWEVVKYGEVKITEERGTELDIFNINVPVTISYHNRDDTYELVISREPILLLYHKGKGKDGEPFKLRGHLTGIKHVKPLSSHLITYNFQARVMARPKLDDTTRYQIKDKGEAELSTHSHHLMGGLGQVGSNEFKAKVIWGVGNNEESG